MRGPLRLRPLTEEEERVISKLARSQSASKRLVERAKIIQLAKEGQTIPQIMQQLHLSEPTVRKWFKRFEQQGLAGLEDAPRPGAPSRYTPEDKARVLEAALTRPTDLNLGFTCWTFDRLAAYVRECLGIQMKKTRIFEILQEEGLRWRQDESYTLRLLIAPNIKAANSFLRAIMDAFGVGTDRAYERSLKRFEAFLIEQYQAGKVPTLFVDEAQNMTRDILKLIHYLLNFETSDVKLLQVVLVGQDELSEKVKRYKELASRMIPIAINPMSPIDLEDMLRFRWSIAAGNKSDLPFTQDALTEIFAYSKGLPRDAIKLSDEILRHVFLQQGDKATIQHVTNAARDLDLEK